MNSNFNRQFLMLDFELLTDPAFIEFVKSPEYATYLLLRRYVWRGGARQIGPYNLRQLYDEAKQLVSFVSHQKLANHLHLKDVTRVSKHLTKLAQRGLIKRLRTGRQNVYMLGEWLDISEAQDGSKRLEVFYLDRKFGPKRDLVSKTKSELGKTPKQSWSEPPDQSWPEGPGPHKNKELEYTIVNVNGLKPMKSLLPKSHLKEKIGIFSPGRLVRAKCTKRSRPSLSLYIRNLSDPFLKGHPKAFHEGCGTFLAGWLPKKKRPKG
jgi:hypothetical protein